MLEALRARAGMPGCYTSDADRDLSAAIESLRDAIVQLRLSSRGGASMLALGFVLEGICS